MVGSNHTQCLGGRTDIHGMVPVGFLLLGQWLCELKEISIGHRVVSLCLTTCITTEEFGNVGIWRTSVSKVIDHVLFHCEAKPWQAGERCKVLDDSSDPPWIWTACALQMCSTWHLGPSQLQM